MRTITEPMDRAIKRMDVSLTALASRLSKKSLDYYKGLDQGDLSNNIEELFGELDTIHTMIMEEMEVIRECGYDLKAAEKPHVQ